MTVLVPCNFYGFIFCVKSVVGLSVDNLFSIPSAIVLLLNLMVEVNAGALQVTKVRCPTKICHLKSPRLLYPGKFEVWRISLHVISFSHLSSG